MKEPSTNFPNAMDHANEGCTCEGKFCKVCEQTKCLGYIVSTKVNNKLYYRYWCKACRNNYSSVWAKANPEKVRKARKKWVDANPDKVMEREQKYRHLRVENAKAWNKANYKKHKVHKDAWKEKNPKKIWELATARRARKMQANGTFTDKEWEQLKEKHDYTCLCCGQREPNIKLTADHVVPLSREGNNYITNIQPLCGPCNSRKHTKIIDYRMAHNVSDSLQQGVEL